MTHSSALAKKKMNCFAFSFILFIFVPNTISLGSCGEFSYNVCWMTRNSTSEWSDGKIWLNSTAVTSIQKQDKFTSLTVFPTVENKLTLEYGSMVQSWMFIIDSGTNYLQVRGQQKPEMLPTNTTQEAMDMMSPGEVFGCENGTLFFHQDENLILAIGYTMRFPIKLQSRSPSMLLISWTEDPVTALDGTSIHPVSLYYPELSSYTILSADTSTVSHYRFTALEPCTPYVTCVEIDGTHSLTCLSTITDPDIPQNLQVTSWNSSSLTVSWDCPLNRRFSLFLLTAFFLNGTDHVVEEKAFWHHGDRFVFTLSDLPPCSRVTVGLQTVCQAGIEYRFSKMVIIEGNSGYSNVQDLKQASSGPNNYTLTWEVQNTSSVSMFRVYNQGDLQGYTLHTNYTVDNLQPCQEYVAKVEALCGESVVMSSATVKALTGPIGTSDLKFDSQESTIRWSPGTTNQSNLSFLYELAFDNGTRIESGLLNDPELYLPHLEEGLSYILNVWEECDAQLQSEGATLCFDGGEAPQETVMLVVNSGDGSDLLVVGYLDKPDEGLFFDSTNPTLAMVVPWSLADPLQVPGSEPRTQLENIVKNKLEELFQAFKTPVRVQLVNFQSADKDGKTKIIFHAFDGSILHADLPLPTEDLLNHVQSLQLADIMVTDGIIIWDGPDWCVTPSQIQCPSHSLCINTLDSYTCVCQHGYYDTSPVLTPPVEKTSRPVCNEHGLFSQCLDKLMAGGIAKAYLKAYFGGEVEVLLNDGECTMEESKAFYYFHTSRSPSQCGTRKWVNQTHVEYENMLTVTLSRDHIITRRDLKVVWKCVYQHSHTRNTQVNVDLEWVNSLSLVEYNASLELGLTMDLYNDLSYTYNYQYAVELGLQDTLYFQVALETSNTFASEVLLEVVSCWATETANPQDPVQGVFLQDGCPIDATFQWHSANGMAQRSRFSIQMFSMPKGLPIYFHCIARICGHNEDCTTNCTTRSRHTKRSVKRRNIRDPHFAVVSAGPLLFNMEMKSGTHPPNWTEHMTMVFTVVGLIGFFGLTLLGVGATKAIMNYYERPRLQ